MMNSRVVLTKIDEIIKKIVNDPDIFYLDPVIFDEEEWDNTRCLWKDKRIDDILEKLKEKEATFRDEEEVLNLLNSLRVLIENFPSLFDDLLRILDKFGYLKKYNLPEMDKFGRVLEMYSISTLDAFFREKIRRERNKYKKRALAKLLNYTKEALNSGVSKIELAYILRKLETFKIFYNPKEYYGGT